MPWRLGLDGLQVEVLGAEDVNPCPSDVGGGHADGGAMVHGGTNQLREEEVGTAAHRYLNGFRHADSGV